MAGTVSFNSRDNDSKLGRIALTQQTHNFYLSDCSEMIAENKTTSFDVSDKFQKNVACRASRLFPQNSKINNTQESKKSCIPHNPNSHKLYTEIPYVDTQKDKSTNEHEKPPENKENQQQLNSLNSPQKSNCNASSARQSNPYSHQHHHRMSLHGKQFPFRINRNDVRYRKLQAKIYNFLERPKTWPSILYHIFVFATVLLCLLFSVLSTIPEYDKMAGEALLYTELCMLFWFFTEYCVRTWSAGCRSRYQSWRGRLQFARRPFCIVDVVVIVASTVVLVIGSDRQMIAASALRGLRFFQILRMFRIDRRGGSWKLLASVFWAHRQELFTTVYIGFLGLIFSSFLMYLVEKGKNDKIKTYADALWWGVITLCTVGYGDTVPNTLLGKLIASICAGIGISFFALPAGILGSGFALKVQQHQRQKHLIRRRVPAAQLIQCLWRCYAADPSSSSIATWKVHMKPIRSPSTIGRFSTIKRGKSGGSGTGGGCSSTGSATPASQNHSGGGGNRRPIMLSGGLAHSDNPYESLRYRKIVQPANNQQFSSVVSESIEERKTDSLKRKVASGEIHLSAPPDPDMLAGQHGRLDIQQTPTPSLHMRSRSMKQKFKSFASNVKTYMNNVQQSQQQSNSFTSDLPDENSNRGGSLKNYLYNEGKLPKINNNEYFSDANEFSTLERYNNGGDIHYARLLEMSRNSYASSFAATGSTHAGVGGGNSSANGAVSNENKLNESDKQVIRCIRKIRFFVARRKFREALRPYDVKDVMEQYSAGHVDMLSRIKSLQGRLDLILGQPGMKDKNSYDDSQISLACRIVKVERQVEHIESKIDVLLSLQRSSLRDVVNEKLTTMFSKENSLHTESLLFSHSVISDSISPQFTCFCSHSNKSTSHKYSCSTTSTTAMTMSVTATSDYLVRDSNLQSSLKVKKTASNSTISNTNHVVSSMNNSRTCPPKQVSYINPMIASTSFQLGKTAASLHETTPITHFVSSHLFDHSVVTEYVEDDEHQNIDENQHHQHVEDDENNNHSSSYQEANVVIESHFKVSSSSSSSSSDNSRSGDNPLETPRHNVIVSTATHPKCDYSANEFVSHSTLTSTSTRPLSAAIQSSTVCYNSPFSDSELCSLESPKKRRHRIHAVTRSTSSPKACDTDEHDDQSSNCQIRRSIIVESPMPISSIDGTICWQDFIVPEDAELSSNTTCGEGCPLATTTGNQNLDIRKSSVRSSSSKSPQKFF